MLVLPCPLRLLVRGAQTYHPFWARELAVNGETASMSLNARVQLKRRESQMRSTAYYIALLLAAVLASGSASRIARADSHERQAISGTVRGNVQRVGFRAMILHVAIAYNLVGSVNNNPDGTVHFILQGDKSRIDQAVKIIGKGTEKSSNVKVSVSPIAIDPHLRKFTLIAWTSPSRHITNPYDLVFIPRANDKTIPMKETMKFYHEILKETLNGEDLQKLGGGEGDDGHGIHISKPRILDTGFSELQKLGKEESGYGLYSYAVLTSDSARSAAFLGEIFKAIPSVGDTGVPKRAQLNIFYIPIKADKSNAFTELSAKTSGDEKAKLGAEFTKSFYNFKMARAILNHVCNPPANNMKDLCEGAMAGGPYIFTYAKPASSLEPVLPPFLFVDLSNIREEAFPEFIEAFRSQVKREDVADGAKIHSMRLTILNITLTAASWIVPVKAAIADIIHDAGVAHDGGERESEP
jgi:acylphosphatase